MEAAGTPPGPSALDKAKSEALDLFSEEKKPKVRKTAASGKSGAGAKRVAVPKTAAKAKTGSRRTARGKAKSSPRSKKG